MCDIDDIHMKFDKKSLSTNIKLECWQYHFQNNLFGQCCYCNDFILIPKTIFDKIYKNDNINNYDSFIPTNIKGTHIDHLHSEYNFGSENLYNLKPSCVTCNLKKGKLNYEQFIDSNIINNCNNQSKNYMDVDVENNKCNGITQNKTCNNKSYFRNKCSLHLHQNNVYY